MLHVNSHDVPEKIPRNSCIHREDLYIALYVLIMEIRNILQLQDTFNIIFSLLRNSVQNTYRSCDTLCFF